MKQHSPTAPRPAPPTTAQSLGALLKSARDIMRKDKGHDRNATRGVGARRERTRPEQLLQIALPMPNVEQQKRGEAIFAQLEAATRLQSETIPEMEVFLPAILDRAFNAEL